ncbi:PQ loop repeat-domain-containing protein [Mycotypha africana]|uniref:PQ loop repeat-domain-containing protein n=1 Tax=Mycotypha africana TaxID=64632 RepID=UPI002300EF72|nr:PQ loop repeat-domain-containing protein [Mycotypha africana]KAI8991302.1 PQ loop repeat-domain-containing protein [Mycotypha africana]
MLLDLLDNETLAKLFGYLSIFCWIIVFTPQFYENYVGKNTEGVSVTFLLLWIFGDILNLLGAVLEKLLFTMLLLAMYYLLADCLIMGQVIYYRRFYSKRSYENEETVYNSRKSSSNPTPSSSTIIPSKSNSYSTFNNNTSNSKIGGSNNIGSSISSSNSSSSSSSSYTSNSTISNNEFSALLKKNNRLDNEVSSNTRRVIRLFFVCSILMWVGLLAGSALFFFGPNQKEVDLNQWHLLPQLLGWGSAILYCSSRIPQIMQNFRNESVEGLSLCMFIFSVIGNVTYCMSIMLDSMEPTYLLINYPWLLGSGGTLFFDFTIFFQFYMYRHSPKNNFNNISPT